MTTANMDESPLPRIEFKSVCPRCGFKHFGKVCPKCADTVGFDTGWENAYSKKRKAVERVSMVTAQPRRRVERGPAEEEGWFDGREDLD